MTCLLLGRSLREQATSVYKNTSVNEEKLVIPYTHFNKGLYLSVQYLDCPGDLRIAVSLFPIPEESIYMRGVYFEVVENEGFHEFWADERLVDSQPLVQAGFITLFIGGHKELRVHQVGQWDPLELMVGELVFDSDDPPVTSFIWDESANQLTDMKHKVTDLTQSLDGARSQNLSMKAQLKKLLCQKKDLYTQVDQFQNEEKEESQARMSAARAKLKVYSKYLCLTAKKDIQLRELTKTMENNRLRLDHRAQSMNSQLSQLYKEIWVIEKQTAALDLDRRMTIDYLRQELSKAQDQEALIHLKRLNRSDWDDHPPFIVAEQEKFLHRINQLKESLQPDRDFYRMKTTFACWKNYYYLSTIRYFVDILEPHLDLCES